MLQTPSKIEGRYGNGLHIYNPSDRHWVHFPMPTVMHEGAVNAFGVHLRASLNANARIVAIHVWSGATLIAQEDFDLRGPEVDLAWDMPSRPANSGLCVCVGVEFLSGEPMGHAHFHSVGMIFMNIPDIE